MYFPIIDVLKENFIAKIPSIVTQWLTDNVDPVGSAVVVDESLSISGAAADAKVTGDEISNLKSDLNIAEKGFALSVVRQSSDRGGNWGDTRIPSFCYIGQKITVKNNGATAVNFNLKDANDTTVQTVIVPASSERTLAVNVIPDHINIYCNVYPIDVEVTATSFSDFTQSELYAIKSAGETVFADPSEWVNGSFEGSNVPTFNDRDTRLRLAQLLHVNVGDSLNIKVNGQKFAIGQWTYINGTWTLIRNDNSFTAIDTQINIDTESYIMVVVAKNDTSATITPSEIALTVAYVPVFKTFIQGIEQKVNELAEGKKQLNFGAFSEGGHIVSHRGEPYPENTLYAFKKCIEEQSKILEMDVAFTSDNVPVLLHDTTINRTGRNADGSSISETINIASITYEQALQYDFGIYKGQQYAGIKIPKLQDVLIYLRQKNCCAIIDLLGHTYTQAQYTILHDLLVATDMITFSALNAYQEQLDVYAELYSDTPFNPTSSANSFSVTQSAYNKYKDKCPLIIVSGYASNASDTTFTYFSKANTLGVVTLLGMMDTVESIQNLFNAGCRMVYSDTIRETQLD